MEGLEGRVFYRFLTLQILLIAMVGAIVLWWSGQQRVEQEEQALREVGSSQARLASDLGVPLSGELAGHFGRLSGIKVGFVGADGGLRTAEEWSQDELGAAWTALEEGKENEIVTTKNWIAVALPVPSREGTYQRKDARLVALKERPRVLIMGGQGQFAWSIVAVLAIGAAYAFARSQGQLAAEEARRKAAERMALLGEMATSIAHEVKNPAAAILMQVRSLEGGTQEELGRMIRDDADEIVSLINQWLFVARPEPPQVSSLDLGELLDRLRERMEAWVRFHRCEVLVERSGLLQCWGDRARLEQVFRNLIQNAVQAMPQGGLVTIGLAGSESEIRFRVADEGEGFSSDAQRSFGEAFYSEREGGMGLGLALVRGVVEAHGGEVLVKNLSPHGALVEGTIRKRKETK